MLQHLTDLVGYDIRLVAGREYDAQLSSQCGITVFKYLRAKSNPSGDPAKQNELRGLLAEREAALARESRSRCIVRPLQW